MYWKLSIEASNEKRRDRRLIWLIKLKHILIRRKQISETWIQYIVFCIFIPVLHMGIALTYENKQKVGSIVTKIQQSFLKRVKKMKGLKLNIYSKCGAQSIVHCTNNDIQKFSWDSRNMFFRHDLERILPYVETISLTLEEESQGLRHLSGSLL